MVRKIWIMLLMVFCLAGTAHANFSITCPTSTDIYPTGSFPIAIQSYSDGSSWRVGTYLTSHGNNGYQESIFRQYFDARGVASTTCEDTAPNGYSGLFAGWVIYLTWQSSNIVDWMTFDDFQGSSWTSTDKGVSWTLSSCANTGAGAPSCPQPPTTTTNCFQRLFGGTTWIPNTCAAGQFCHYIGLKSGHQWGACYTACEAMAGYSNCSCVAEVDQNPAGTCPLGWISETNDGKCIIDHTQTGMCYAP